MSNAGIFTLISNDGKQDSLLMATQLLSSRLDAITKQRKKMGEVDPTPMLVDIEKTHVLFMSAQFKPFAAIGFEYSKVSINSGQASLGGHVQFSIPQFGDFFHDIVLHVKLSQPTLSATASGASDQPAMRWCSYPGERLCKRVQMQVNGNSLDEYANYTYNLKRELQVGPHKALSWNRCMGQEIPESGFLDQPNWAASGVAPSALTHRSLVQTVSGNQTPTGQKDVQ
jgi:hypothetical protein